MLKTSGKLIYEPFRRDFKKTHKVRTLILDLKRDDLDLYYQWFLRKQYGEYLYMNRPMYGLHVTVVAGNEHIDKSKLKFWKTHQNEVFDIEYDPSTLTSNWAFWNIKVKSDDLMAIRKELGLSSNFDFHITIGRQHDWQPKLNG